MTIRMRIKANCFGSPMKSARPSSTSVSVKPSVVAIEGGGAVTGLRGEVRVRYEVNTEGGSSGSPCFDHGWRLVTLHHLGGPPRAENPKLSAWNQGVPVRTIARTGTFLRCKTLTTRRPRGPEAPPTRTSVSFAHWE